MAENVSDVGEFGLIHRIRDLLQKEGFSVPAVTTGLGDDTAAFLPRRGYEILVTCDSMVEGRHYLPAWISPHDLGRRAMVSNISDIGAMGGLPLYALVSLGLRGDLAVTDIEAMYRGFLAELNPFGAAIIGGNITGTGDKVFIDITLLGEVAEGKGARRSTARAGDIILVTGYPGRSAAGLHLLLQPDAGQDLLHHPLVRAYNLPSHKARAGHAAVLTGCVTSMIDTSDGFLGDLGHICEESRVGATLYEERLPVSDDLQEASQDLGIDPHRLVLGESDDYELILTCEPRNVEILRSSMKDLIRGPLTEVGTITAPGEGIRLIRRNGRVQELRGAGWDHFAR
ncbi:MAG: thiamine-phosphate kinase [Thermodesulfobacteriota bacterium]